MNPSDFYFNVKFYEEEGMTAAILCPIEFFEDHGHLSDDLDGIEDILPDGFYECTDATFETEFDVEEAKEILKSAGFVSHKSFDAYINNEGLEQDEEEQEFQDDDESELTDCYA